MNPSCTNDRTGFWTSAFAKRLHRGAAVVFALVLMLILGGFLRKGAYAETVCYRVQISQNANKNQYHTNSVCKDDNGKIKIVDNGSNNDIGVNFNLFEIRDYHYDGPNSPAVSSVCPISALITAGKTAVCKPVEGFDLSGETLVDMLKEQCGGLSCEWGNSTNNSNYRLLIGGSEKVSEEEAGESQVVTGVDDPNAEAGPHVTSDDSDCQSGTALLSLGWVLCPILEGMSNAANDMYDGVVKDALQVEPELFTGGNQGTFKGWETFRNIANTIFIILFLVVIFSQLTGVGIDNYGIKKILPKLIVAAILINLSYWICLIFVDLSNILGNALQAMFNGLADGLTPTSSIDGLSTALGEAGATVVSVAIITAIIGGAGVLIWANPAMLLTLFVALVGVVISVVFLFVLLSVRQAAIVVLIVLSPLAVAMYMLPNTKSLFNKWAKFMEGLLLVFPIAGLLVGGGNYVSRLLLASGVGDGGVFSALTAMVVGIVPVFFIPMVLRSAFTALGTLGARLTGMGARASGALTGAMRNSGTYRNAQEHGLERQTRIRAGLDREGNQVQLGRLGRLMRGGSRNIARNRAQYLRNQESRIRENNLMGTGFDSALAGVKAGAGAQMVADYESLINNGEVEGVNANDVDSVSRYHRRQLAAYATASANGDEAGKSAAMAQVKAAQNILSKSDGGRSAVQNNFEGALRVGQTAGLSEAAGQIMSDYGDKYKSANRGAHAMMADLATSDLSDAAQLSNIQSKLDQIDANGNVTSGAYSMAGTGKYTAESLAGADDQAIQRLANSVMNQSMQGEDLANLQATAYEALEKQKSGNLNIKPEVARQLEQIAGSYVPAPAANDRAAIISHGAYEDARGNVYHLREMNNGKFLDDSGFEVDITHFKKR